LGREKKFTTYKGLNQEVGKFWMNFSARGIILRTILLNMILLGIKYWFWSVIFILSQSTGVTVQPITNRQVGSVELPFLNNFIFVVQGFKLHIGISNAVLVKGLSLPHYQSPSLISFEI
jgi:hypothetical protein